MDVLSLPVTGGPHSSLGHGCICRVISSSPRYGLKPESSTRGRRHTRLQSSISMYSQWAKGRFDSSSTCTKAPPADTTGLWNRSNSTDRRAKQGQVPLSPGGRAQTSAHPVLHRRTAVGCRQGAAAPRCSGPPAPTRSVAVGANTSAGTPGASEETEGQKGFTARDQLLDPASNRKSLTGSHFCGSVARTCTVSAS